MLPTKLDLDIRGAELLRDSVNMFPHSSTYQRLDQAIEDAWGERVEVVLDFDDISLLKGALSARFPNGEGK
jgi:hypothetical protein